MRPKAETVAPDIVEFSKPNGNVRVFTEKQVSQVITQLLKKEGHQPQVDEVFENLPDDQCIAKAPVSAGFFRVIIPKHGNFVVAAETDAWGWKWVPENGSHIGFMLKNCWTNFSQASTIGKEYGICQYSRSNNFACSCEYEAYGTSFPATARTS